MGKRKTTMQPWSRPMVKHSVIGNGKFVFTLRTGRDDHRRRRPKTGPQPKIAPDTHQNLQQVEIGELDEHDANDVGLDLGGDWCPIFDDVVNDPQKMETPDTEVVKLWDAAAHPPKVTVHGGTTHANGNIYVAHQMNFNTLEYLTAADKALVDGLVTDLGEAYRKTVIPRDNRVPKSTTQWGNSPVLTTLNLFYDQVDLANIGKNPKMESDWAASVGRTQKTLDMLLYYQRSRAKFTTTPTGQDAFKVLHKPFEVHHLINKAIRPEDAIEPLNLVLTSRGSRNKGTGWHESIHRISAKTGTGDGNLFRDLNPAIEDLLISRRENYIRVASGHKSVTLQGAFNIIPALSDPMGIVNNWS